MNATIFLNITHGFQARMLLRSGISEELLHRGARLVICSPNADEPYFAKEFDQPQIVLQTTPTKTSVWEDYLSTWRQYMLMNPRLGGTLNHKRETLRRQRPLRYLASRCLNLFLGNLPFLRRSYMWGESKLFAAREFDPVLTQYQPDLVVTGTPGFNRHDVHVLRSAKRLRIPTATVMLSWDNLTSKGYMNGIPDYLLVWSELMAKEAVEYHDYPPGQIFQTGAAQFDHYYRAQETTDKAAWRASQRIPANAFLMMYGTINPAICEHEVDILKTIIAAMRTAVIERPPFLWIRLHPQVVHGNTRRSLEPFLALRADDVYVEIPPVNDSKLEWDLPKKDTEHLRSLLASSDMVITTSSTLSIDAACAGTPIVNVFFDGRRVHPAQSVARFKKYTHYAKILSTGGIYIADTPEEFTRAMHRYAADRQADAEQRERIIAQQIGTLDGRAGIRTAEQLLALAVGHRDSAGSRRRT